MDEKIESLNVHKEAERMMLGFTHPRSHFEVDIYPQPTVTDFSEVMKSSMRKNVRGAHFSGHSEDKRGFFWLNESSNDYVSTSPDYFAELFKTEKTIEFVLLMACETFSLGQKLIAAGVPFVICWRSAVRDRTAIIFSYEFYSCLDLQDPARRDYPLAFRQAVARMSTWKEDASERKPAKHMARNAVDMICLLKKDGEDEFPDVPAALLSVGLDDTSKAGVGEKGSKGGRNSVGIVPSLLEPSSTTAPTPKQTIEESTGCSDSVEDNSSARSAESEADYIDLASVDIREVDPSPEVMMSAALGSARSLEDESGASLRLLCSNSCVCACASL